MYIMGTLLRHGNEEQKRRYLPGIASGELRLQAFGVTEPTTGSDTTQLQDAGRARGRQPLRRQRPEGLDLAGAAFDLMLLLARTTPVDQVKKTYRRALGLPRRSARGARARASTSARSRR